MNTKRKNCFVVFLVAAVQLAVKEIYTATLIGKEIDSTLQRMYASLVLVGGNHQQQQRHQQQQHKYKQQQTSSNCSHLVFDPDRDWNCPVSPKSPLVGHGPATCPPNYFIAGTRKGGTTSLHTYLTAHSDIFPFKIEGGPMDGEVFSTIGSSEYTDAFRDVPTDLIVGDASVSRLMNAAEALSKHCQHARILLLLRDPVERCFSQMTMRHRMGTLKDGVTVMQIIAKEVREFEKQRWKRQEQQRRLAVATTRSSRSNNININNNRNLNSSSIPHSWYNERYPAFSSMENCLYEGAYVVHLRRLLQAGFPRSQVRIYWSEDLFHRPAAVVRDALAFVGSDPSQIKSQVNPTTPRITVSHPSILTGRAYTSLLQNN